jgi:hypothetical protein
VGELKSQTFEISEGLELGKLVIRVWGAYNEYVDIVPVEREYKGKKPELTMGSLSLSIKDFHLLVDTLERYRKLMVLA